MSAKSSHGVDRRAHRDLLAEYPDRLLALYQTSANCSWRLEANDQNSRFWDWQIVSKVMHDPPARTHAVPGHDHARAFHAVQGL